MTTNNYINNFTEGYHVSYHVEEIENVTVKIVESLSSESVYVNYYNEENGKKCVCRFSTHSSNAVASGDTLNGNIATRDEIMFFLGLKKRTFIPATVEKLVIESDFINKSDRQSYERCPLTIKEMYAMGEGADLSEYVGKATSDGKWLIKGNTVKKVIEEKTRTNKFGETIKIGEFIYE